MTLPITFTISQIPRGRYLAQSSTVSIEAASLGELGERLKDFLAHLEDESDLVEPPTGAWSAGSQPSLERGRTSSLAEVQIGSAGTRLGERVVPESNGFVSQAVANGDERLTLEEIKARYAPDWVLIGEPETNEFQELLAGRVLYHGPDRDEVTRMTRGYPPGRYALEFLGKFPEDMEFVV